MEKKRLVDILNRAAARRRNPNPPKEFGCCCKYDPYNDVYVKEDDVEMQNCKFPASFHEGTRCKDVYCGSLVDVTDPIMQSVARRKNPPKEFGCCCKYNQETGYYVKEDGVEMHDCKSPSAFYGGMRCKDVDYCGPLVDSTDTIMPSVAGKQGDNAPILSGPSDTEPVTRFAVTPSCLPYNCPPVPPNYNPAASTQYFQWVQTWSTLMFNWNDPQWAINRVAIYNILRDQYLQAFAPGIDPDKAWPPYNNLGI